jgi:hypothetical protein
MKTKNYLHKELHLGWFRISIFWLGKKFCIRFELQNGW